MNRTFASAISLSLFLSSTVSLHVSLFMATLSWCHTEREYELDHLVLNTSKMSKTREFDMFLCDVLI